MEHILVLSGTSVNREKKHNCINMPSTPSQEHKKKMGHSAHICTTAQ